MARKRYRAEEIIRKADLEPWPKVFQNLRSTRETELAESFPIHVVCKWIGNSQPVAAAHYLQLTDEHFDRAVGGDLKAAQNAAQKLHETNRNSSKPVPSQDAQVVEISAGCDQVPAHAATCEEGPIPPRGVEPLFLA